MSETMREVGEGDAAEEVPTAERLQVAVAGVASDDHSATGWACAIGDGADGLARVVSGSLGPGYARTAHLVATTGALHHLDVPMELRTDSQQLADSLGRWLVKWRNNGWRTQEGNLVRDRSLIETAAVLMGEKDAVCILVSNPDPLLAAAYAAAQAACSRARNTTPVPARHFPVSKAEAKARTSRTVRDKQGTYRGVPKGARHPNTPQEDYRLVGTCPTCGATQGQWCAKQPRYVNRVHPERLKKYNIPFGLVPGMSAALSRVHARRERRRRKG